MCQRKDFFKHSRIFLHLDENLEEDGTNVKNDKRFNNNGIKPLWKI